MTENPKRLVLICDDDELIRFTVGAHLRERGFECIEAADGIACVDAVRSQSPSCVVLDLTMPRMDGLTALGSLRKLGSEVPVVVITATGGVESAIAAVQLGAQAYLEKPVDVREVGLAVERALEEDRLKRRVTALEGSRRPMYGEFIGRSPAIQPLLNDLRKLESVAAPTVLLLGESGTGKDVVARTIHALGPRKKEVFINVDCTSLPEALFESELFGHEKGSFTDAKTSKRGLFEVAGAGVVFLDEIGELAPGSQAKLLRALENRVYKRVGGVAQLRLEACVIAATNRDLLAEVKAGRFREDLYYRLDVVTLRVPPLRERRDDIPLLVSRFISRFNQRFGRDVEGFTPAAMERLLAYNWPGNVRELKNLLERLVILDPPQWIDVSDLPTSLRYAPKDDFFRASSTRGSFTLPEDGIDLADVERSFVVQALERCNGNRTGAARLLGISRFQLRNRIVKFKLTVD